MIFFLFGKIVRKLNGERLLKNLTALKNKLEILNKHL